MKPTIHIVFGFSGAGKDTVGAIIQKASKSTLVKFAAPGKRALEGMLHIPVGSLDDRVFRQQVAPWCQGRTYLQVLIDFYKHKALVIGEDLFTQQTFQVIINTLDSNRDVIITDLRSWDEYRAIVELANLYYIKLYWVERKSARMLESDILQESIYQRLKPLSKFEAVELDNNGTFQDLRKKVQGVL